MFYSPRRAVFSDVVAVPATATTSSAVISSDELKPFEESSFGSMTLFIRGDNAQISAANPLVKTYVSYDEGENWVLADTQTVDNATFTFTNAEPLALAPRVRVDVDLNGATLGSGHGLGVDVVFEERETNGEATLFADVVDVPDTVGADTTTTGDALNVGEYIDSVYAVVNSDSSTLTDVTVQLQSSWDGTNWWDLGTATDVSGADFVEFEEANTMVGTMVRANVITAATTGDIATNNGLTVNLFARRRA